ncbi:MAG: TIM barrel protein, partial [Planctomycetes bacterium]|nr:TIM barrel protein [Planctomycetota bacterium]
MKLGFVSAILPDLPLDRVVEFAFEAGYSCVELMCWPKGKAERRYAGVTHLDVTDFGRRQVQEVRQMLENSGVSISSLGYYPNYLSPEADEARAVLAHFKKVIQAAALL